jgi:hypothetical protein
MDELTLALRREGARFQPSDSALQRVVRRGARRQRRRRLGSAAVGLGVLAVVDLGLLRGLAPRGHVDIPAGPSQIAPGNGSDTGGRQGGGRHPSVGGQSPGASRVIVWNTDAGPLLVGPPPESGPPIGRAGSAGADAPGGRDLHATGAAPGGSSSGDKGRGLGAPRQTDGPGGRHHRRHHHSHKGEPPACLGLIASGGPSSSCTPAITLPALNPVKVASPTDPTVWVVPAPFEGDVALEAQTGDQDAASTEDSTEDSTTAVDDAQSATADPA